MMLGTFPVFRASLSVSVGNQEVSSEFVGMTAKISVCCPDGAHVMSHSSNARLNLSDDLRYHPEESALEISNEDEFIDTVFRWIEPGVVGMDVSGVNPSFRMLTNQPTRGVSSGDNRYPAVTTSPQDELHISTAGRMLDQLTQTPEIREQRLNAIREMIANGTYDTEAKLEAALEKMLNVWRNED